jgi:hypothetical protein
LGFAEWRDRRRLLESLERVRLRTVRTGWSYRHGGSERGGGATLLPSLEPVADDGAAAMAAGGSDVRGAAMRNPLDVKKIASKKTNSTRLLPFS